MKYLLLLPLALLCTLSVSAQKGNIKGKVYDETGVLPSVPVKLGDVVKTITEEDGFFRLSAVDTGLQVVSIGYMGYDEKKISVRVKLNETVDMGIIRLKPSETSLEEINIKGSLRQGGTAKAINMTKMSNKALTVLSSEGISKSPVRAMAQVVRQAPGVAVRDNKVSLRGTPVAWTTSLLNGDPMPTADEHDASRTFNFEVFPSSLIDYIVVNRTVTPDMDGDNIGGIINFITKAPQEGKIFSLDIAGGYDMLSRKPLYMGSFIWGNTSKDKKLSYVINGSYNAENNYRDAPSVAYGTNYNHSLARLQLDREQEFRQTIGANAAVNYQFSSAFKLGANFMTGNMTEDEYRYRTSYNWSDGSGQRIRLWNSRGLYEHNFYGASLVSTWKINDKLKLEGRLGTYANRFRFGKTPGAVDGAPNGNYTVEYISPLLEYTDVIETNFFGQAYNPNNPSDPNPYPYKMLDIDNPYGTGGDRYNNIQPKYQHIDGSTTPLTPADYYLSSVYADLNTTWEKDPLTGKLDLFYKKNNQLSFQAGFRYRTKEGARNVSFYEYRLKPGTGKMPLSGQATESFDPHNDYLREWGVPYKDALMPVLTRDRLNSFVNEYRDSLVSLPMDENNNEYMYWAGSAYAYREDVRAGYLMAEWKPSPDLLLIGGLRVENTHLKQSSDTIISDMNAPVGISAREVSIDRSYLVWLPSLNALYTIDKQKNVRLGASRTFHRPNFEQTKPGFAMFDRFSYLFTFGNPDLKPAYAVNLDLTFQHFWDTRGMFSVGAYYKHIDNHIFITNQIDEGNNVPGYVVKGYQNARKSQVAGAEILVDRKLDFLPGVLSGLGVSANLTYSWSKMDVPGRTKSQPLTDQTPLMYNLTLFYEKGKVDTRVMLNYTGAFSTELNLFTDYVTNELIHDNTDYDVFMGSVYSLDYQFSYLLSKRINIYANVNNILNAPYRTYIGVPERPLVTAYTRQKFYLGIRFNL